MTTPTAATPRAVSPVAQLAVLVAGIVIIVAAVPTDQRAAVLTLWLGLSGTSGVATAVYHQVTRVKEAVGPANGENVQESLTAIRAFQAYQQTRNHRIVNLLQAQNLMLRELLSEMGVEVPEPPPGPDAPK